MQIISEDDMHLVCCNNKNSPSSGLKLLNISHQQSQDYIHLDDHKSPSNNVIYGLPVLLPGITDWVLDGLPVNSCTLVVNLFPNGPCAVRLFPACCITVTNDNRLKL